MNLVHVVPHISAEASGPSYSVPRLCQSLAERGHEVTLSCLRAGRDIPRIELSVHLKCPLPRRFAISPSHARIGAGSAAGGCRARPSLADNGERCLGLGRARKTGETGDLAERHHSQNGRFRSASDAKSGRSRRKDVQIGMCDSLADVAG